MASRYRYVLIENRNTLYLYVYPLFEVKHGYQDSGQAEASVDNATFDTRLSLFVGT